MARVLIAGCGYVGCALGVNLSAAGHRVWGLRRTVENLPKCIAAIQADLADPSTLDALPGSLDTVVYCPSAGRREDEAYRRTYVEGIRNLLAAFGRGPGPPGRLIYVSSTAVYGQSRGEWVHEDSPTAPVQFSGRRLLEGERIVAEHPVGSTILRLGGIYGPQRARLVDAVARQDPIAVGAHPSYSNRIHRDDGVGILEHLITLEEGRSVYLGVDHEPAPTRQIVGWIAGRLDLPHPPEAPAPRGQRGNKRCHNWRIVDSGYRFRYPSYREGFSALIEGTIRG